MHVNSFRYGHTDLKWRIRGNQNFIWSKKLQGSNLTISNLEKAGVYEFWTESESETSAKVQIDIRMDTPEMIFDKILTYKEIEPSSQWQKEFTASIKLRFSDHPEIPLIRHLLESRNEIHDLQRRESDFFFDLIHMAERYMNALNSTMNAWQRSRPVINYSGQFELKMPQPLETIRLSEVGRAGEKYLYEKYCDPVSESEYVMLPAPEDTLIKITPVAFNGKDWLNVFFHYQPDEIRAANLWDKARLDADKLEQIMLDDTEIATLKTKLTESEKKNWKLERAKNPYDFIVSRPAVTANDSQTFIAVNIPDYDLLAATEKAFYVSVREEDLLFRDDFDYLVPVTGPEVYIDRGARNIDGNVFFYLQDANGKIISRLCRHDFYDEDISYYSEATRLAYFELYERQLRNLLRYYLPSAEMYIADTLARFRTIPDVDIDCIYQYIFAEIPRTYKDKASIDKLMFVILEDWASRFNVDRDFFTEPIAYSYAQDIFHFPAESDGKEYLLCVGTVSFDGAEFKPAMSYFRSGPQAIEVQARASRYYFMYAIDLHTFHRSGFIFVDTHNKVDPVIYRSGIDYERM